MENFPLLVTGEPFTLFQRNLQAAGGKQIVLVGPGALPTGLPCQQAQGPHRSSPSLQQTCRQRPDFPSDDKYPLSHSPGEKAARQHPPSAVTAPGDLQFGKTSSKHFSSQSQLSSDNRLDGATCWINGKSSLCPQCLPPPLPLTTCPVLAYVLHPDPDQREAFNRKHVPGTQVRISGSSMGPISRIVHVFIYTAFLFLLLRPLTTITTTPSHGPAPPHPRSSSLIY